MSFLKMFRSKKPDKENDSPTEEDRKPVRNRSAYNSTRRDRRSSVAIGFEDTFSKATAPYHTVTQPKQTKGTRSCTGTFGRDEYERYAQFRAARDPGFKSGSKFGKRRFYDSKLDTDFSTLKSINYDEELLDSDDSFGSEDERRTIYYRNDKVVKDLKTEVENLDLRLQLEVDRKLHYKQKLLDERRTLKKLVNQLQRKEFEYDRLVSEWNSDRKVLQTKIAKLEHQLTAEKLRRLEPRSFGGATFTTPTSTSNDQSSVDEAVLFTDGGAGEMLCSASESTLPIQNAFPSVADSMDEVKNFRKDDTLSSLELARADAEARIEKLDLDSTLLNDTETEHPPGTSQGAFRDSSNRRPRVSRPASGLRRSLSDTDLKKKRRSVAFKMTNL